MASISLRVRFLDETAIGPGKVRLLELIAETGSISAAARAMAMSYHRAWNLVDELNRTFGEPLVDKQPGGRKGGGATLTRAGAEVVRRYRAIERSAERTAKAHLVALERMLAKPAPSPQRRGARR
jgi:molybdate transport system regulatory protein